MGRAGACLRLGFGQSEKSRSMWSTSGEPMMAQPWMFLSREAGSPTEQQVRSPGENAGSCLLHSRQVLDKSTGLDP